MLQYDVAKFAIRDRENAAAQERLARQVLAQRGTPLRTVIGRRLVRVGLRLASAQG